MYDVRSIEQFLDEARAGHHRIYSSTIVYVEVLPSQILKPEIGSFDDFVDDLRGAAILIEASPNVMSLAGRLRDLPYRKGSSDRRRLGTPDAIMLASCIYLDESLGIEATFHTFDDGKKRGPEGKSVPLLSYHEWCEGFTPEQMEYARRVITLDRRVPSHPNPRLFNDPKAEA
jgi:predicted nucleic acid-binding protein